MQNGKWPRTASLARAVAGVALLTGGNTTVAQWREWSGPNGNFVVDTKGIADAWPAEGRAPLWKRPLGEGYSSVLFDRGNLYTMYSDGDDEVVISLDADTGKTAWEYRYLRTTWDDMYLGFGHGPNATPLIADDRIIAAGIAGTLHCLDLASGELRWQHDLTREFGRRKRAEEYGYSASPRLYDQKVIVQVGGNDHAVVAFHPSDGSIAWKSAAGGISYGAASIVRLAGKDQYVYFEPEGVAALDPENGKLLWRWTIPVDNGNHLTPVVRCDDHHLFVASQFTSGGGRLLNITTESGGFKVEERWFTPKLRASCWTHIRIGDYIYGSAGGHDRSRFTAFDWRTGEIAWRARDFHMAQCLRADGKVILLDQDGHLALLEVSPAGHKVLGSETITQRVSWTVPTLVGTRLFIRDRKHIMAIDIGDGMHRERDEG